MSTARKLVPQELGVMVSADSSAPVAVQVHDQLVAALLQRSYRDGDQLPTVRELAQHLQVSSAGVAKAYSGLEKAGFVQTLRSRGTFVLPAPQPTPGTRRAAARLADSGAEQGLTVDDLVYVLRQVSSQPDLSARAERLQGQPSKSQPQS